MFTQKVIFAGFIGFKGFITPLARAVTGLVLQLLYKPEKFQRFHSPRHLEETSFSY